MSTVAPQVTSIARAHAGSLKMAVVSSGPRYMVQRLLTQARLDTLFDVVARPARARACANAPGRAGPGAPAVRSAP
jgi:beta-phosphoglucomutase-like phosphatase (HAD superfamily)